MLRRSTWRIAGVADFVDSAYLRGVRPRVPGGEWTASLLRGKSVSDLQQLWFMMLRERNMLHSMRDHYIRHTEELGAFPAPSRIKYIENSMNNIRLVMQERDFKAADEAEREFERRIREQVYRFPPGPSPAKKNLKQYASVVRVVFSTRVDESRLRELLGRYEVFEEHRGIAKLTMEPTAEAYQKKQEAESTFEKWYHRKREYDEYSSVTSTPSVYDTLDVDVELAPGVALTEAIVAGKLPVPPTKPPLPAGTTPLERIRAANRSFCERQTIQLGYYPNLTSPAPPEPGPRPTHPDEIEGPWECIIVYGQPDGFDYVTSLGVTRIDGSDVLAVEDITDAQLEMLAAMMLPEEYTEALAKEEAEVEHLKQWPMMPEWHRRYEKWAMMKPADIIRYNYTNVFDYADREAMLTGRSILDPPATIDPTCGRSHTIPPHAKRPVSLLPQEPMEWEDY